jgi:hypothetical protein
MIELLVMFLLLIVFVAWCSWNADTDYKYPKQLAFNLGSIALLSWYVFQVLPLGSFLVFYALASSCYMSTWPRLNHFCSKEKKRNFLFLNAVSTQFIDTLVLVLMFLFFPTKMLRPLFDIMPIVSIIGAIWTFIPYKVKCERLNQDVRCWGYGANSSVNSTLMSLIAMASLGSLLPYHLGLIGWCIGFLAVIRSMGSAGIIGISAGSFIYGLYHNPIIPFIVTGIVLLTLPLWWNWSKSKMCNCTPLVLFGRKMHPFFSLSYRDIIYKFAWKSVYQKYAHKWFGIGNGTFYYAMPAIQIVEKEETYLKTKQVVMWLHSTFFQWAIEGGKVGAVLLVLAMAELIFIGHKDAFFMSFSACLFINSCFNFPDKMPVDSFLSVMVIKKLVYS